MTPSILMYHSIATGPDPMLIQVTPQRLRQQLATLRRLGYRGVSMRDLLRRPRSPGRMVGLTFDDGYTDFATTAVPLLAEFGFTATVYMVSGHLGGCNEWDPPPARSLMTADQLRAVHAAGHEVGSHGISHLRSDVLEAAALETELAGSRSQLQDILDEPVPGFCFPYGALSQAAVAAARQHYDYAVAVESPRSPDRWSMPRFFVGEADSPVRLAAKLALKPVRERRQRRAA